MASVEAPSRLEYTPTRSLTIEILLAEIKAELEDLQFAHRTHGKPATYNSGCRGHLCAWANRTRHRERRREAALTKLPSGVQPDTRSRQERHWDVVICHIMNVMEDLREQIAQSSELRGSMENTVQDLLKIIKVE